MLSFLKKMFIISPLTFIKYQLSWNLCKFQYKQRGMDLYNHSDSYRCHKVIAQRTIYEHYRNDIVFQFKRKYKKSIIQFMEKIDAEKDCLPHENTGKIWVPWFQGLDAAPDIVKICFASIQKAFSNREVVLITEKNYSDYVSIPDDIIEKYKRKEISVVSFSDIIRINLLIEHGGTWIDGTVLWTSDDIPSYMLDSNLFIPRTIYGESVNIATLIDSYFITAKQNHPILLLTRELLYTYWRKYHAVVDYLLLYDFFEIAISCYSEEWDKVVPFARSNAVMLSDNIMKPYSPQLYAELTSRSPFQKLSWRLSQNSSGGGYLTILDYIFSLPKWEKNDDKSD